MSELKVHKRRVPVRIMMFNHESLDGKLYSDLHRPDGTPASIIDRLNDRREKFLPLAVQDQHHLLNKSRIVSVTLDDEEIRVPAAEGVKGYLVRTTLSTGAIHEGTTYAYLPPARSRVLDYLNGAMQDFIPLWCARQLVLVNVGYIASVTEMFGVEQ